MISIVWKYETIYHKNVSSKPKNTFVLHAVKNSLRLVTNKLSNIFTIGKSFQLFVDIILMLNNFLLYFIV